MVTFTPNIYVMQYLEGTNKTTPEVVDSIKNNLRAGEQNMVTFTPNIWMDGWMGRQ